MNAAIATNTPTLNWHTLLRDQKTMPYFQAMYRQLEQAKQENKSIYPQQAHWFEALKLTPAAKVRVVILGQDPYHGPNQAHGLCFSVQKGQKKPPSLQNIFKELQRDLNITPPPHGDLTGWAQQGVLLLNTILTVEEGQPGAHRKLGWETFTDHLITQLSQHSDSIVFLLWGSYAQSKACFIDTQRHTVLKTTHPSPLSAHRGFLGCGHFSKTNAYLKAKGLSTIDWAAL